MDNRYTKEDLERAWELGRDSAIQMVKETAKPYARMYIHQKLNNKYNISVRSKEQILAKLIVKIKNQEVPKNLAVIVRKDDM